jgi:cysteinyl-tRNA synthetase
MLTIFNSLTGKKERFPRTKKTLNLFVCGPTVYDHAHLGHARTYLTFDIIARYLRASGYRLYYAQNITDIDDKIIDRAKEQGESVKHLAERFEKEYMDDMAKLNVRSVNRYARASEHIAEIQDQIGRLIEKGIAYRTDNGVYFEVRKYKEYGKLSRQHLEELRAGWRIEPDPEKKDPLDFALWKLSEAEPRWESPWGNGRPGWHIEDTAIAEKLFGSLHYDLHGGGVDLKFPHHECEIAQAEAISPGKPFVKLWMHSGHLLVEGEKMSKSLGNFITIREFLKTSSANALRLLVLSHHYRSPIDYTKKLAEQAENSLETLEHALYALDFVHARTPHREPRAHTLDIFRFFGSLGRKTSPTRTLVRDHAKKFEKAMQDDFNTPTALATLFSLLNEIQKKIYTLKAEEALEIREFIQNRLGMLGLEFELPLVSKELLDIASEREQFRNNQQFTQADALRKKLEGLGYRVEDTPLGPLVYKVSRR